MQHCQDVYAERNEYSLFIASPTCMVALISRPRSAIPDYGYGGAEVAGFTALSTKWVAPLRLAPETMRS